VVESAQELLGEAELLADQVVRRVLRVVGAELDVGAEDVREGLVQGAGLAVLVAVRVDAGRLQLGSGVHHAVGEFVAGDVENDERLLEHVAVAVAVQHAVAGRVPERVGHLVAEVDHAAGGLAVVLDALAAKVFL